MTDERFRTNPDRVRNREELVALVSARFREHASADWQERLTAWACRPHPSPTSPSRDCRADTRARDAPAGRHEGIPELRLPALPLSFDRERATHASAPPGVGEHTAEILEEVGYSPEEIAALARDGVIRTR